MSHVCEHIIQGIPWLKCFVFGTIVHFDPRINVTTFWWSEIKCKATVAFLNKCLAITEEDKILHKWHWLYPSSVLPGLTCFCRIHALMFRASLQQHPYLKLFEFADIEFQVLVVAPRDQSLCKSLHVVWVWRHITARRGNYSFRSVHRIDCYLIFV